MNVNSIWDDLESSLLDKLENTKKGTKMIQLLSSWSLKFMPLSAIFSRKAYRPFYNNWINLETINYHYSH